MFFRQPCFPCYSITINTGGSTSDPHLFETGTPVRLVPKIRSGVDPTTVDKRVIRLPKGFDTSSLPVIAPGRTTGQVILMALPILTSSRRQHSQVDVGNDKECCSSIYMYSPETDSIDYDVEIGINQFVLDESYDLHKYV